MIADDVRRCYRISSTRKCCGGDIDGQLPRSAAAGVLAGADASLPVALSVLLQPAGARARRARNWTPRAGAEPSRRRPHWAFCRCIFPAASRWCAGISSNSSPRLRAGLYSNLITSAVLLEPTAARSCRRPGLDHVQISLQDLDAATADRIAGLAGAQLRKTSRRHDWCARSGMPLTVNLVVHRQNIERLEA